MENSFKQHSFYGDTFVGRTSWPFWLFGLFITFWLYSNTSLPGGKFLWGGAKSLLSPGPAMPFLNWLERISSMSAFGVYVLPVLMGIIVLFITQRLLRRRPLRKLINGLPHIRWRRIVFAFFVFMAVAIIFWAIAILAKQLSHRPDVLEQLGVAAPSIDPFSYSSQEPWRRILFSVLTIPVSVLVYEMIYRGYLDQSVRRFISSRWMALIIGASLYSLFKIIAIFIYPISTTFNSDLVTAILMMFMGSFVYGLFFSLLCDHDHGIEAVIGIGMAEILFQDFAYRRLLTLILDENYRETFTLPIAATFHYYLFIPAVLLLLIWNYGADRDRLS